MFRQSTHVASHKLRVCLRGETYQQTDAGAVVTSITIAVKPCQYRSAGKFPCVDKPLITLDDSSKCRRRTEPMYILPASPDFPLSLWESVGVGLRCRCYSGAAVPL